MKINYDIKNFVKDGYIVQNLYSTQYIDSFREIILDKLRNILNNKDITLETFHDYVTDDNEKISIQYEINKMIWDERLHEQIIKDNINIYYDLIGKDLDIQTQPYLRIARPNSPQDNIGFHRDTFYGSSAYELSSVIPLVDLNEKSALMIEPGSHKKPPIPYTKIESETIKKGDVKNQLGFQYAPKIIDRDYKIDAIPIPLKFKQILAFGLGTIHGQEVNSDSVTRWSIDVRVKNSFVDSGTKDGYYRNLTLSVVGETAKLYYENNKRT
ncbi:hypothetical protein [Sulfurimonas sp.]